MASTKNGDITIYRGANAPPVVWQFLKNDIPDDQTAAPGDLFDLTGSTLFLTIGRAREFIISANSADNGLVLDTAASTLTWAPSISDTRALPSGRIARYEIERRFGLNFQEPLAMGFVIVLGGLNSD